MRVKRSYLHVHDLKHMEGQSCRWLHSLVCGETLKSQPRHEYESGHKHQKNLGPTIEVITDGTNSNGDMESLRDIEASRNVCQHQPRAAEINTHGDRGKARKD